MNQRDTNNTLFYSLILCWENVNMAAKTKVNEDLILVLNEERLSSNYHVLTIIRAIKDFQTHVNLRVICNNEHFNEIEFGYMGRTWLSIEFNFVESKENSINMFVFTHGFFS